MTETNIFKSFSYVVVGRVVAAGLQGIFYIVFALILQPEQYGEMSYIIAIAVSASVISRFGLPFTVTVYQAKKNQPTINTVNVLAVITTSTAAIILLFVNPLSALLCLGLSFFFMTQHNFLGLKKYKIHMINHIAKGSLVLVIPLGLYFIFDLPGIVIGIGIGTVVCGVYFLKLLSKKDVSFSNVKKSIKVIIHNLGLDISLNLPGQIDKLVIVPLVGFALTGLYQFNLQIVLLMEILPLALHSVLLSEESSGHRNKKLYYAAVMGSILLALVAIILAPIVIEEIFPKYRESIQSLQIMALSIIPLTIAAVFNAKLQAKESTRVGYSAFVRIGTLLGLFVLLSQTYGLIGIAFLRSLVSRLSFSAIAVNSTLGSVFNTPA